MTHKKGRAALTARPVLLTNPKPFKKRDSDMNVVDADLIANGSSEQLAIKPVGGNLTELAV
ncbi:hypothetical protein [uncultured Paraglaciecola sp.]|uniref:hypothetical protein n=1 Tax=uncultured Paraglaciecola sp. TaxID=1765024 RepID=UPI002610A10C|nr:hypothetical protein [uncultured Paraglaciecola sp.]